MIDVSGSSYSADVEKTMGQVPCQNCGRLVWVMLPFWGCVFCSDCAKGDSSSDANTEDFQSRWLRKK